MVKRNHTIHRQKQTNCLCEFDHFVGLALKVLPEVAHWGLAAIIYRFIEKSILICFAHQTSGFIVAIALACD